VVCEQYSLVYKFLSQALKSLENTFQASNKTRGFPGSLLPSLSLAFSLDTEWMTASPSTRVLPTLAGSRPLVVGAKRLSPELSLDILSAQLNKSIIKELNIQSDS